MNKTIAKIGYAPISARAATGYTYDAVTWFDEKGGAGRNVSSTPYGENYEIFGNGYAVYAGEINNGRDIEVELIDILDDIREDWLGEAKMTNGYVEKAQSDELPRFALLVAKEKFDSAKKYQVDTYFDCQVSLVYDGQGHSVSNVMVNHSGAAGLFGTLADKSEVKNLKLIDCEMIDTDLSFEKSTVHATVLTKVDSIKNPRSGRITVPEVGKIIMDDPEARGEIVVG